MQLVTAASLVHEVKLQQLHTQVDEQLGVIGGQVILNPNANILKVVCLFWSIFSQPLLP